MAASHWWTEAFTSAYLEVYHHRSDAQAAQEIAGLVPRLAQAPGPIVDAGCGSGRHLAALRDAGLTAIGFDLSADLLAVASGRQHCRGRLARADLRRPPFSEGCGAVLCLFTAFGYFDDAGNAACLAGLGGMVAPGGWVLLDLPEPEALRGNLQAASERRTPGGWIVRERRWIAGDRVEKSVEATPPDAAAVTWQESVRLYREAELHAMANAAGLVPDGIWPGLRGPDDQAGRLVCWLRRP